MDTPTMLKDMLMVSKLDSDYLDRFTTDVLAEAFELGCEILEAEMDVEPESASLDHEEKELLLYNLRLLREMNLKRSGAQALTTDSLGDIVVFNN